MSLFLNRFSGFVGQVKGLFIQLAKVVGEIVESMQTGGAGHEKRLTKILRHPLNDNCHETLVT